MKKVIIIASALILLFAFAGCGQTADQAVDSPSPDQPTEVSSAPDSEQSPDTEASSEPEQPIEEESGSEKILVYLSGSETMINKLEETFEAEHGDVCDFVIMSCGQLRSKVWAEKEAGKIQADVIWGSDPLIYNKLDDEGLLDALEINEIDNIKDEYVLPEHNYQLVNERYITIIYNKDTLAAEPPASFKDLTDSKYSGLVVKADASQSSTAFAITSSLYQLNGNNPAYFQGLKDNGVMLCKSNGLVPSTIMEGQFSVGIGPHDAVVRLKNKGKKEDFEVPLEIVWPSEGVIGIQRPVALSKDDARSKEKDQISRELINFLLSNKAQTITTQFGFVSVRKDIENTFLPEGVEVYNVDWEQATQNDETVKQEYQNIFHK